LKTRYIPAFPEILKVTPNTKIRPLTRIPRSSARGDPQRG